MDKTIDQILQEARDLLKSSKVPTGNKGRNPEVVIYRVIPTGILAKQCKVPNFTTINVFKPSEIPVGFPEPASIVLHAHWWYEPCQSHLFCHEVGYSPIGSESAKFNSIWGYLYNPPIQINSSLNLRLT